MSLLVAFAGFSELDLLIDQLYPAAGSGTPVHCGCHMELTTPAVGPCAVGYTFEPADLPLQLPPVWRCSCGFQLDAWVAPDSGPATAVEPLPAAARPTP